MSKWPTVKLGDVAHFIRGITFKPTDIVPFRTPGSVVCMRTKNVQALLDESDIYSVPTEFVKRKEQYLEEGDLLISSANSWNLVGKCCWVGDLGYLATAGGFISILRADRRQLLPRYLYHWFASEKVQDLVRNCGRQTTNISNLDLNRCGALEIPLPPLDEQRRIATILDKADALRQKRRQAIAKLDELAQATFLEMFGDPIANPMGWPIMAMTDIFEESPIFGTMIPPSVDGGEWLSLRVANIQNDKLDLSDRKYVSLPGNMIKRHSVVDGDMLMARAIASQEHLGKAIIAYPGKMKWAFDSHLMRMRFKAVKAKPEYVRQLLMTPGGRSLFLKVTRRSSVQYNINTKEISSLRIPVPPIATQDEFSKRLSKIDALRSKEEDALASSEGFFGSLQSRAFAGDL